MEKAYAAWRAFQDRFLAPAAALLMLGCTLLALLEVVRRYVFGVSFEWQQDAVTYFILCAVFLYFGISQRHGAHLTVDIFVMVLQASGPRARRAAEAIQALALLIAFVFLAAVVWWGLGEVLESQRFGARTESLEFPITPFLWVLLVGFAFMAVSLFFQCYRAIHGLIGRRVLQDPQSPGEALH